MIPDINSRRSTFTGFSGGGGSHKRIGSILSALETFDDDDSTDEDSTDDTGNRSNSSSNNNNGNNNNNNAGTDSKRSSVILSRLQAVRKFTILQTIRKSINSMLPSSQKRMSLIVGNDDVLLSCLNLNGKTIRIPGCHGNSVIKVQNI